MGTFMPFTVPPGLGILLKDLGIQPTLVLRRAKLPLDVFEQDRTTLGTQAYFRLWQSIEAEAGEVELPLRIAEAITAESLDPCIFAVLCSSDLNIALRRLSEYKRLVCPMVLHIDVSPRATTMQLEWLDKTHKPPASLVLTEIVFFVSLARLATRENIRPRAVGSPCLPDDLAPYTEFLGVEIQKAETVSISFGASDAVRPFLTKNEAIWKSFEPGLSKRLDDLEAVVRERVHVALLELLPSGSSSAAEVAKKLGMSKRTLQRRLKEEGVVFQEVLDATREALARHYLGTTSFSGAEISFLLGFDDPNSFSRAFSAWTGTTPGHVREVERAT